ncbi:pectinesterase family protein [Streptomyces sp. CA-251387]|uniref:pectinesterase family protein n=1 Tax=Streptomyces sp. CA-251387 TaxID=3240064 RepID=UPI003D8A95AA
MRRRAFLAAGTGLVVAGATPAFAAGSRRVLHVRPGDSVQAAVDAVDGPGWTIVLHPGTYREVVKVPAERAELTLRGATRDPRDAVIVYDNANGTPKPDGSGTYGTAGSATFTSAAPGQTVRDLTLANDWLRADHADITGTQAVAAYVTGDRSSFENVRFLAHQDTLFVDTTALDAFDRQYFHHSFSSPVTVEHTWAFGNGKNRWGDSAFAGDGNGYKLGGDGETVAHLVNNSAAWDNAGNGFTENSNKGAIVINRTTAYANAKWGYCFATGAARLGKNLAVSNGSGLVSKGSSVVSSGNNWDSGIATPAFRSTDASTTYNARQSDGSLPATTFLTTGSTTIGATMD